MVITQKNLLFMTFSLLASPAVNADFEIKLKCRVSITSLHISSLIENKSSKDVIFDVMETGNYLYILSDDDDLGSVSTATVKTTISIANYSNANRWDISNLNRSINNQKTTERRTIIDRNTGNILQRVDYGPGIMTSHSEGVCVKVDTTKKLF